MRIQRGDIFYINPVPTVGCEKHAGRPAIIVSNDRNNESCDLVEVVYLTTQPKGKTPTHVTINSSARVSTAQCEHVYTVDKSRVGDFVSVCTREEMELVDLALIANFNLHKKTAPIAQPAPPAPVTQPKASVLVDKLEVPFGGKLHTLNVFDVAALMAKLEVYESIRLSAAREK